METKVVSIVTIFSLISFAIATENPELIIEDTNPESISQDSIKEAKAHKRNCIQYSEEYLNGKRKRTTGIVFTSLGLVFIGLGLLSSQHPGSEPASDGNRIILNSSSFTSILIIAGIPLAIIGSIFTPIGIAKEIANKKMLKENGCDIPKRNAAD